MAAFIGVAKTTGEKALVAATAQTLIQIVAAANQRVKVLAFGVFLDGVLPTGEPVQVDLVRQSTAGTSSASTPVKWDDSIAETLLTTARETFTVEPTSGDILWLGEVHPQSWYEVQFPMGQEPICGGGDRIGVRVTPPASVAANARSFVRFEE